MLFLLVHLQTALSAWPERLRARGDGGQATAEYILVVLGAAAIAVLVGIWATQGGGKDKIGSLLDAVFDKVKSSVS